MTINKMASSVDPDEMAHEWLHLDLHCITITVPIYRAERLRLIHVYHFRRLFCRLIISSDKILIKIFIVFI